jgi:hypothetical protein
VQPPLWAADGLHPPAEGQRGQEQDRLQPTIFEARHLEHQDGGREEHKGVEEEAHEQLIMRLTKGSVLMTAFGKSAT